MRARSLKPGFFVCPELLELQLAARLLFAGLWCCADREGRLEDRPAKIKLQVLPGDDVDVDALLNQLAEKDFIQRYEVEGKRFIQVVNFGKHQRPHKNEQDGAAPPPRMVQEPGKSEAKHNLNQAKHNQGGAKDALTPSSLTPSSLTPDTTRNSSSPENNAASEEATRLADLLQSLILASKPDRKLGSTWHTNSTREIDRALRIDHRDLQRLEEVLRWSQQDSFWWKNILSGKKLREKFDQLEVAMRGAGPTPTGPCCGTCKHGGSQTYCLETSSSIDPMKEPCRQYAEVA